ncbi:MAG: bifunctional oligoribonuclease/PAP phosphatase NrnA [Clostridia bacterium]|nr:bifunctional oligoribonuclease/PAP phosphatase NrnA [Clostridia bacterium]
MTLDNIKEEIKKANTIVIVTHESPDGDAVGSSLAMYLALKQLGKDVDIVIPTMPRIFEFLPSANEIKKEGRDIEYDLGISLDCTDTKRLEGFEPWYDNAKVTISIDHHRTNAMFADYNYVDPVSPACSQILVIVLMYLGIDITKEIGECILTGIITDTGGFKYEGVTTETFEIASKLLGLGVNLSGIYKKVMQVKTKANFELTKVIMDRMEFFENGKIAFTYITKKDEEKFSVEPGDHEGLVEIGRDIEGVEVSIFIRETEKGFKTSLRSNEYVNVAEVAAIFSGGGHIKAAGCTLPFVLEKAKEKIIERTKTFLK